MVHPEFMREADQATTVPLETIKAVLRKLIVESSDLKPEAIVDSSSLDEDIQLTSIAFVEIQAALEEMFDIEIDPVEVVERNTFVAVAQLIAEKVELKPC
jgi:acyl carrier protein